MAAYMTDLLEIHLLCPEILTHPLLIHPQVVGYPHPTWRVTLAKPLNVTALYTDQFGVNQVSHFVPPLSTYSKIIAENFRFCQVEAALPVQHVALLGDAPCR